MRCMRSPVPARRRSATALPSLFCATLACALGALGAAPAADAAQPRSCAPAVVFRGDGYTYRATKIQRWSGVSCRKAVHLLQASYGYGPLRPYHVDRPSVGRPIFYLRGGWRCTNGAGGASCWSTRARRNVIHNPYVERGFAVSANVG